MYHEPVDSFSRGFVAGILIGEGSFTGDKRQASVQVRMHTRHRAVLERLAGLIPGSRLYGPYDHGGRDYMVWMLRGNALVAHLPLLDELIRADLCPHVHGRYVAMKRSHLLP